MKFHEAILYRSKVITETNKSVRIAYKAISKRVHKKADFLYLKSASDLPGSGTGSSKLHGSKVIRDSDLCSVPIIALLA